MSNTPHPRPSRQDILAELADVKRKLVVAEARAEEAKQSHIRMFDEMNAMEEECLVKCDHMAGALLFYADEKNWTERDDGTVEAECDIGEVARKALKDAEFANASAPKECERCEGLNEVACQRGYEIDRLATALWKLHAASKNTGRRVGVEWDMVRKIISVALTPQGAPDHTSDTK